LEASLKFLRHLKNRDNQKEGNVLREMYFGKFKEGIIWDYLEMNLERKGIEKQINNILLLKSNFLVNYKLINIYN